MSTRASSSAAREAGFSLAEVLLAIALLGLLAVGASALLTQLVEGSDRRRSELLAHTRAVAVMESLLTRDYAGLSVGTATGTGPLGATWSAEVSQQTPRLRRLRVSAVRDGHRTALETMVSDRFDGVP